MANVLTVGYDQDNSDMIRNLLQFRAHETHPVANYEEAMATLGRYRADLIIINPMLSGTDGFTLCESLKSRRDACQIPVVILTSQNDNTYREQSVRSGSNAHVTMPYTPDQLFLAVDQALTWAQSRPARRGAGQIVFDTHDEHGWLRQTNDMNVDVLTVTTLPEGEAGELKRVVLEAGDTLRAWGHENRRGRVASLCWEVERERVCLEVSRDELREGTPDDPLTRFLDALVGRCGFVPPAGSQAGEPVVLEKVVRV